MSAVPGYVDAWADALAGGYADISVILGRQEMGLEKDPEAGESEADEQKEQEQITQKAQ